MSNAVLKAAVAGLLGAGLAAGAIAQEAAKPKFAAEKCYGIAKAGANDCQTNSSACAGTSKTDNQKDAWIYVPRGTCGKIVGGSTKKG